MSNRIHKALILFYVILPFCALLLAIALAWNRFVFLSDIALLLALQTICALGVTVGYHRMLTHDSFKTIWPVRALFVIAGCIALEGKPIAWTSTHIKHHAHSDDDDDPHSPLKSFWHAHMGWLFDLKNFPDPKVYAPHLLRDPLVVWIDRLYPLWAISAFAIPFAIGGWTGLLWGGFVRVFLTTHITWSVNSVCHTFGKRHFETTDESRNNWIVGLLAFGEGWHNNHHAFPKSAFHGMRWYQFDLSGIIIRSLELLGLATEVQRATPEMMEAHRVKGTTMHENIAQLKEDFGRFIDQGRAELNQMWLNLPPQKLAAVRFLYEEAMQQCTEVQLYMARRRNVKKIALERRRERMTKLMETLKQQLAAA